MGPAVAGMERRAEREAIQAGRDYEAVTKIGRHNAAALEKRGLRLYIERGTEWLRQAKELVQQEARAVARMLGIGARNEPVSPAANRGEEASPLQSPSVVSSQQPQPQRPSQVDGAQIAQERETARAEKWARMREAASKEGVGEALSQALAGSGLAQAVEQSRQEREQKQVHAQTHQQAKQERERQIDLDISRHRSLDRRISL